MKDGAMDYEEILSKYSNKSLDTSSLEKKLEVARPLDARPNELDFWTTGITFNTIREGINAQTIIEKPEKVSEAEMTVMARDIAKRVENEMDYPGQIKVNVIRESRAIEYAK